MRSSKKQRIVKKLMQAIKELNLVKAGKLNARNARDLIHEL
jgi:hypothetical protein